MAAESQRVLESRDRDALKRGKRGTSCYGNLVAQPVGSASRANLDVRCPASG